MDVNQLQFGISRFSFSHFQEVPQKTVLRVMPHSNSLSTVYYCRFHCSILFFRVWPWLPVSSTPQLHGHHYRLSPLGIPPAVLSTHPFCIGLSSLCWPLRMPLFGKSTKSPAEVVRSLRETMQTLEKGADAKKQEKVSIRYKFDAFSSTFTNIKSMCFNTRKIRT